MASTTSSLPPTSPSAPTHTMEPSQPQSSPLKAPSITISPSKNHVMERVISQQLNSSPGPQWATENNPHPKAGGSYAGGSPAPSVDGLVDVDEEIDELLGDDDVQEGAEEKDGEPEKHKCHWGQCQDDFDSKQEFYGHVKDHINASKEYACEWRTCSRVGHKQGRSLLLTHIRGHTGERPYSCTIPGCNKAFARTDALNKHKRTVHADVTNPNGAKPSKGGKGKTKATPGTGKGKGKAKGVAPTPSDISTPTPAIAPKPKSKSVPPPPLILSPPPPMPPVSAPDEDLILDPELAELIPRLRSRWPIVPEGDDEIEALREARRRFPRHRLFPNYTKEEDVEEKRSRVALDELVADPLDDPVARPLRRSDEDEIEYRERVREYLTDTSRPPDADLPMEELENTLPPLVPAIAHTTEDPEDPEGGVVDVLSRSRWQARYIMAKARLLLLEEENMLRRRYLQELAGTR
ncbi:zinc-finger protein [Cryptococcus neoformans Bt1]|nr:zinc-finger protein [Cryptococcus neoformans var. grubii Bt1]OXG18121.1 zinc-finger protein [Cryptococcus neoformans var. grubii Ze90-1]